MSAKVMLPGIYALDLVTMAPHGIMGAQDDAFAGRA